MDFEKNLLFESLNKMDEVSLNKIQSSYDDLIKHMKGLAKDYKQAKQSGDKESEVRIVNDLKALTAKKKDLEQQLHSKVAGDKGISGGDTFAESIPSHFTLSELIDLGANNVGDVVRMGEMDYTVSFMAETEELYAVNEENGLKVP